jgi:adenylate cyclase
MGTDRHQVVTVMGPVVNLASRLQDQAEPGQILVGEATYRHTHRSFQFAALSLELKGISRPISAYAVGRALPWPGKPRGIEGLHAPLIGRDDQLAALQQVLTDLQRGRGRMVSLIGEAGVGKSRLVAELKQAALADGALGTGPVSLLPAADRPSLLWLEGRCLELGMNPGYSLFLDLFRDYVARSGGEEGATGGTLLETALRVLVETRQLSAERADEIFPLLAQPLSLRSRPFDEERLQQTAPEQLKHQTFRAARDFFLALARTQPVVLVLEDLHWADSLSLDLISFLVESVSAAPLCLLCVSRPEPDHQSRHLAARAAREYPDRCLEIHLEELSVPHTRRLIQSLLSMEALPSAAWEAILARTGGNPFFVEEVIRSLIGAGLIHRQTMAGAENGAAPWRLRDELAGLVVPETVQSVIQSRVDRLDRTLRQILQCASVIGSVFSLSILETLMPGEGDLRPGLSELEKRALIFRMRAGEAEQYSFCHMLTRDTVYGTLLRRPRTALHRKVADALVALHSDSLEEHQEEIAEQYARGDAPGPAIRYLLAAGQKAARLYANQEAIRCFRRALDCVGQLPERDQDRRARRDGHAGLGDALFRTGAHRDAQHEFQRALALTPAATDAPLHAALSGKLADALHWQGQLQQAIAVAEAGLATLPPGSPSPESVEVLEVIMRSRAAQGDLTGARRYAGRLKRILPRVPYFPSIYMAYYQIAFFELKAERFAVAADWLNRMEVVCVEHHNENGLARCFHGRGDLKRAEHLFAEATLWLSRSLEICERTGDAHLLLEGHGELAHLLILLDANPREIESHLHRWDSIAAEMLEAGAVLSVTALCRHLGKAYLERGDRASAAIYLRRALELSPPFLPEAAVRDLEQLFLRLGCPEEFAAISRQRQLGRNA